MHGVETSDVPDPITPGSGTVVALAGFDKGVRNAFTLLLPVRRGAVGGGAR